jgi:prevent-host-death family protein
MAKRKWTDGPHRPGSMDAVDRRLVIRLLETDNPKTPGGHPWKRYGCYRDRMTVDEFLAAVSKIGESEQAALDDLGWDQNQRFIRLEEPSSTKAWSVAEAKAKLSEILRLARAGQPQTIGTEEPCVVVSAEQFDRYFQPEHLGRFLIESAPREYELDLPSRASNRGDPFADDANGRAA